MLQTLWPTGELNFNKPNDITGEYKAIKCTELAQRPTLGLNSNDLLPDSIATYTIAIAMADELPDVTDVMANRRKSISTSPAYNRRVQSKLMHGTGSTTESGLELQ
jgi:hypothetical protein